MRRAANGTVEKGDHGRPKRTVMLTYIRYGCTNGLGKSCCNTADVERSLATLNLCELNDAFVHCCSTCRERVLALQNESEARIVTELSSHANVVVIAATGGGNEEDQFGTVDVLDSHQEKKSCDWNQLCVDSDMCTFCAYACMAFAQSLLDRRSCIRS